MMGNSIKYKLSDNAEQSDDDVSYQSELKETPCKYRKTNKNLRFNVKSSDKDTNKASSDKQVRFKRENNIIHNNAPDKSDSSSDSYSESSSENEESSSENEESSSENVIESPKRKTTARQLNIESNQRRTPIWIANDPYYYIYYLEDNDKQSRYAIKQYDNRSILGYFDSKDGNYYDGTTLIEKIIDNEINLNELIKKKDAIYEF
jgi:hypothetical protein